MKGGREMGWVKVLREMATLEVKFMSEAAIIIRPMGGRRFTYAYTEDNSNFTWVDDPEMASIFSGIAQAEEYKKEHKNQFSMDDRAVVKRHFDGQHCRFCYADAPTLRRNAVECREKVAMIEFQCVNCNIIDTASFGFASVSKGPIGG